MPSTNPFTEEGRTRFRNFKRRAFGYFALWFLLGALVCMGLSWYMLGHSLTPLQRVYLRQYAVSTAKQIIPHRRPTTYSILTRVVVNNEGKEETFGCTDTQVEPLLDDNGKLVVDPKTGPQFRFTGPKPKYFYWRETTVNDGAMATWLRENIYHEYGVLGQFYPAFLAGFTLFVAGCSVSITWDRRSNKKYEKGNFQRGTRILSPKEFGKKMPAMNGIGLHVAPLPERSES